MIVLLLVSAAALTRVYDPQRLEQLILKSNNLDTVSNMMRSVAKDFGISA